MRDRYLDLTDKNVQLAADVAELRQKLSAKGVEVLAHTLDLPSDGRTQLLEAVEH